MIYRHYQIIFDHEYSRDSDTPAAWYARHDEYSADDPDVPVNIAVDTPLDADTEEDALAEARDLWGIDDSEEVEITD